LLTELSFYNKPTVIVEGSPDVSLIKTLFVLPDSTCTKINVRKIDIRGNKKGLVIKTLKELSQTLPPKKNSQFIGIVDRDFNEICNNKRNDIENLFYIDKHDFDAQIFSSDAFKKYLQFNIQNPEDIDFNLIRDKCVKLSSEFGYYLLSIYELKLFQIKDKIHAIDNYIDNELNFLEASLLKRFQEILPQEKILQILKKVRYWKSKDIDPYQLSNGHDLVRVLFLMLLWSKFNLKKKKWNQKFKKIILGNKTLFEINLGDIEDRLRECYERLYFQESIIFSEIIKYQTKFGLIFIETS